MRIFYMTTTLDVGGTEAQLTQTAIRLAARGHNVTVGCITSPGKYASELQTAGIPVHQFYPGNSLFSFRCLGALWSLRQFLRRNKVDVVHTYDLYSNLVGIPAAWLAQVPTIISSRRELGVWWWYTPRNRKILRAVQSLSTWVVANSNAVRDCLIEDGYARDRIRVIYNGIDTDRFRRTEGRNELLPEVPQECKLAVLVANMHVRTKGHEVLIDAARSVCERAPNLRFLLVGDGELRSEFEARVRESGLAKYFLFCGLRDDVPKLLPICDFGILASSAEGMPNAVLEYMSAGLAVVATRVGGAPELIEHGVTGLLVPPNDAPAMAAALLTLINDESLVKSLGQAALQRAQNCFSFNQLIGKLESLYSGIRTNDQNFGDEDRPDFHLEPQELSEVQRSKP